MTAGDPRRAEEGVVLVNVLVVLAIAGGLVFLLIGAQEAALDRVSRAADAAIAEQIAIGAEASVVDALRRDLDTAPDTDHLAEPWARAVVQEEVALATGRFSVAVTDLQAKFDINRLAAPSLGTQEFAKRLFRALDLPEERVGDVIRLLRAVGRVDALDDLAAFGVPQETLDTLRPHVTALPVEGTINLNSVDPFLLGVMLQNDSHALQLVSRRSRQGFLTRGDLAAIGALRPENSGFQSNVWLVDVTAEAGSAATRLQTVLVRRNRLGVKGVDILSRRFVYDVPAPDTE
ncbi:hypothetical protein [Pseudaestuariivita sp.]|uniref:hypothetical protein n=1 Tax=Pseudaestuariivita sp. TaxID=2211669 RepID=UPI0040582C68